MSKHTPGPWEVDKNGNINIRHMKLAKVYANGPVAGSCTQEDIANARLIAAAPDMLEALYSALNLEQFIVDMPGFDKQWHFAKIRAAIVKAEGSHNE